MSFICVSNISTCTSTYKSISIFGFIYTATVAQNPSLTICVVEYYEWNIDKGDDKTFLYRQATKRWLMVMVLLYYLVSLLQKVLNKL